MIRFLSIGAAVVLMTAPCLAETPVPACDSNEAPRICSLKLERNECMDRLAMCDGDSVSSTRSAEKLAEWWKSYLKGIDVLVKGNGDD